MKARNEVLAQKAKLAESKAEFAERHLEDSRRFMEALSKGQIIPCP